MRGKLHRIRPDRTETARGLRQESTFPERLLWSRLRNGQLMGLKFRRQHAIGPYVGDFYCASARLVVELDGETHVGEERVAADLERTRHIESAGLRVIRFTNDDVIQDVDAVLTMIARECGFDV